MLDPSFVLPLLLQSALVPFGVALAALLGLRVLRGSGFAAALALAAGFVASYFAVFHAQWSFVPHQALDWLPWIAVLGAGGAMAAERAAREPMRIAARIVIGLIAAGMVIWPASASLGLGKAIASIAVTGLLAGAAWTYLARAADSRPTPPLLLAVIAGGAGLALMLDSSQAIGQLSGALAAALAACAAFNIPRMRAAFGGAASGIAVLLLAALLANAWVYSGFPLGYVVLLAAGLLADPLVAAANRLRRRQGSLGSWTGTALLSAVPVLVTIVLAVKTMQDAGGY